MKINKDTLTKAIIVGGVAGVIGIAGFKYFKIVNNVPIPTNGNDKQNEINIGDNNSGYSLSKDVSKSTANDNDQVNNSNIINNDYDTTKCTVNGKTYVAPEGYHLAINSNNEIFAIRKSYIVKPPFKVSVNGLNGESTYIFSSQDGTLHENSSGNVITDIANPIIVGDKIEKVEDSNSSEKNLLRKYSTETQNKSLGGFSDHYSLGGFSEDYFLIGNKGYRIIKGDYDVTKYATDELSYTAPDGYHLAVNSNGVFFAIREVSYQSAGTNIKTLTDITTPIVKVLKHNPLEDKPLKKDGIVESDDDIIMCTVNGVTYKAPEGYHLVIQSNGEVIAKCTMKWYAYPSLEYEYGQFYYLAPEGYCIDEDLQAVKTVEYISDPIVLSNPNTYIKNITLKM